MAQQVRYLGASIHQVRWGGNDDPRDCLVRGTVYTVKRTETHSWHTKIELEEWPGQVFNNASFEYLKDAAGRSAAPEGVRHIRVAQADGSCTGQVIPKVIIEITEPMPEHKFTTRTLEEVRNLHRTEAKEIAAGLMDSLPQGTLHELLIALMQSYACVYRGPTLDAGSLIKTGDDGILT